MDQYVVKVKSYTRRLPGLANDTVPYFMKRLRIRRYLARMQELRAQQEKSKTAGAKK